MRRQWKVCTMNAVGLALAGASLVVRMMEERVENNAHESYRK